MRTVTKEAETQTTPERREGELAAINRLSRTPLTDEAIYTFAVRLCDNQTDRDDEYFDRRGLEKLADLFVGKTGIFDHSWSAKDQTARIYRTELVEETGAVTEAGEPGCYLKAYAYMLRTPENASLIAEIEGGIKKEVSVSCAVSRCVCSIHHDPDPRNPDHRPVLRGEIPDTPGGTGAVRPVPGRRGTVVCPAAGRGGDRGLPGGLSHRQRLDRPGCHVCGSGTEQPHSTLLLGRGPFGPDRAEPGGPRRLRPEPPGTGPGPHGPIHQRSGLCLPGGGGMSAAEAFKAILARYGQPVELLRRGTSLGSGRALLRPLLDRERQFLPTPLGQHRRESILCLGERALPFSPEAEETIVQTGETQYTVVNGTQSSDQKSQRHHPRPADPSEVSL
ncbi:MAG: hypothetical protein SOR61_06760 [Evtepia sp.]|uniref:hypothetical protein n=1 Tax=Evtepia sp. TaxID=2773933 RepID=UPI002A75254B|nr:hypothetical protein [Evtepia sp.]MDY3014869.1 hypothetical protein [Evtepia sp.]